MERNTRGCPGCQGDLELINVSVDRHDFLKGLPRPAVTSLPGSEDESQLTYC